MLTADLATKFSPLVDKAFKLGSMTEGAFNKKYDFDGTNSVKIYNFPTVALVDYERPATGTIAATSGFIPKGVGASVQTKTLTKDRAFSIVIDKLDQMSTNGALKAGEWLRDQIDMEVTPEIDIYRLAALKAAAPAGSTVTLANLAALTNANVYSTFLSIQEKLSDAKVPRKGRIAFMNQSVYNMFKTGGYVTASDAGYKDKKTGDLGLIDGVEIRVVPASYMPTLTGMIITHPEAACAPMKLSDYQIHKESERFSGWVINGRVSYDCFALDQKKSAIGKLAFTA